MAVLPDDPAQPNVFQLNDPDRGKSHPKIVSFGSYCHFVNLIGIECLWQGMFTSFRLEIGSLPSCGTRTCRRRVGEDHLRWDDDSSHSKTKPVIFTKFLLLMACSFCSFRYQRISCRSNEQTCVALNVYNVPKVLRERENRCTLTEPNSFSRASVLKDPQLTWKCL